MTCIIGAVDNNHVIIGGDSLGLSGYNKDTRTDAKVFKRDPFVIGFTTSFRMGQILRYTLNVPKQSSKMSDYEFMVTTFINAVRDCLKTAGFATKKEEVESGGTFIVGYRGQLYVVEGDYQVATVSESFTAVGDGHAYAKAAMYAQAESIPAKERITKALEITSHYSACVGPPFNFVSSEQFATPKEK